MPFSAPAPSHLAFVPFVSVQNMMELVYTIGIETFLRELGEYLEADFKRWSEFDKTPRVATHSAEGVIELMPTSDSSLYGFKYVNGHPKNMKEGLQTVTAFGMLADAVATPLAVVAVVAVRRGVVDLLNMK